MSNLHQGARRITTEDLPAPPQPIAHRRITARGKQWKDLRNRNKKKVAVELQVCVLGRIG
jgi:hypothetical protein